MNDLKTYQGDEGFLFEIINAVPSGIFVTDLDHNILIINRAGAELVGRSPGDCFDRKCYEIFNTPMCRTEQCTCKVATKNNEVNQGQTTLMAGDREIPIEFASRPLKNIKGEVIGCVEHFIDISDRLEKERLIVKQQEELLRKRDEDIRHLQEEILELSTPVIEVWDGVLALPLVGTLDSHRAQSAMERLLTTIESTRSPFVIVDITGVPNVDTAVANYLLQTVDAVRLMGSEAILTGISSRIALTMAHLGVDLGSINVRSRMADGLHYAMQKLMKLRRRQQESTHFMEE